MKRGPYPSERYTCRRCGLARVRNAGLNRRKQDTGLCKDCFCVEPWTCTSCGTELLLKQRGFHMHEKHHQTSTVGAVLQ